MYRAIMAGLLLLAQIAQAQDTERLDQLETEVRALKQRLARIEASIGGPSAEQKPVVLGTGWKSLTAWRELKTGMAPSQVRAILGEPARIDGGGLARWYYPN